MTSLTPDFARKTCPVKSMRLYNQLKDGSYQTALDSDIECVEECGGIRTQPRTIGSVVLPSIFDRTYCEENLPPQSSL